MQGGNPTFLPSRPLQLEGGIFCFALCRVLVFSAVGAVSVHDTGDVCAILFALFTKCCTKGLQGINRKEGK